jgi:EAL domain-containing protein (putative c-di-GMP-specific phosphodiesterase class I)
VARLLGPSRQFETEDIVALVRSVLRRTGTPPALLELEITESVLVARPESAVESVRALRDLGVRFSLDDFGTGYSSLGYLKHLPIDRIKVDRTFVAELGEDRAAESIVSAVVSLAHGLGIEVIAEGIETELQLDRAVALGCDRGRGSLFAARVGPDALVERRERASRDGQRRHRERRRRLVGPSSGCRRRGGAGRRTGSRSPGRG